MNPHNPPCQICGAHETRSHIGGCRCPEHDNFDDAAKFPIDDFGRELHQAGYAPMDGLPRLTMCNSWEFRRRRGLS